MRASPSTAAIGAAVMATANEFIKDASKGAITPVAAGVGAGVRWFSDTPLVAGSRTMDSWCMQFPKCMHFATFTHLESKRPIVLINSHFSHEEVPRVSGWPNPRVQAAVIEAMFVRKLPPECIVVSVGDRNSVLPRDFGLADIYKFCDLTDADDVKASGCARVGPNTTFLGYQKHPRVNKFDERTCRFAEDRNLDRVFYDARRLTLDKYRVRIGLLDESGHPIAIECASYRDACQTQHKRFQERAFASDHALLSMTFSVH